MQCLPHLTLPSSRRLESSRDEVGPHRGLKSRPKPAGSHLTSPSKHGDAMKNFRCYPLVLASAVALGGWSASQAQTLSDLRNDHATPTSVLTYGMGYSNQRYSPLKKINKGNAGKLAPVWNYSLNNSQGQESQPIVYDGMMFVTTHTATVAIDALTGRQLWKQELEFPSDV